MVQKFNEEWNANANPQDRMERLDGRWSESHSESDDEEFKKQETDHAKRFKRKNRESFQRILAIWEDLVTHARSIVASAAAAAAAPSPPPPPLAEVVLRDVLQGYKDQKIDLATVSTKQIRAKVGEKLGGADTAPWKEQIKAAAVEFLSRA